MNPIYLHTSGPYRRRCRCLWCHPRHGWRRRARLSLLVLGLILAAFVLVAGCSGNAAGLPGDPDSQPAADAGPDMGPVQVDALVDAQLFPEVGADTGPEVGKVPLDGGACDPFAPTCGPSEECSACGACVPPKWKCDPGCSAGSFCSIDRYHLTTWTCHRYCRSPADCPIIDGRPGQCDDLGCGVGMCD